MGLERNGKSLPSATKTEASNRLSRSAARRLHRSSFLFPDCHPGLSSKADGATVAVVVAERRLLYGRSLPKVICSSFRLRFPPRRIFKLNTSRTVVDRFSQDHLRKHSWQSTAI